MTTIRLNGREHGFAGATVADLLASLSLDPSRRGIAVAVNGDVVRRADWTAASLAAGDEVEVIRPLQGG